MLIAEQAIENVQKVDSGSAANAAGAWRAKVGLRPWLLIVVVCAMTWWPVPLRAQIECTPWGNIRGIRVGDQRIDLETSVRMIWPGWSGFFTPAKYLHRPKYSRQGATQSAEVELKEGLQVSQITVDQGDGQAKVSLNVAAFSDIDTAGIYWCIDLTSALTSAMDADGYVELIEPADSSDQRRCSLQASAEGDWNDDVEARGIRCVLGRGKLELVADEPLAWGLRREPVIRLASPADPTAYFDFSDPKIVRLPAGLQVYAALLPGKLTKGQSSRREFTVRAVPEPDRRGARLVLEPNQPGPVFDGIGGNFRLQFPETDPEVIAYCLDQLPVAWGRIAMPWSQWHPKLDRDPIADARAGKLDDGARGSLEMARKLAARKMPVIVSVWDPPTWATSPDPEPDTLRGIPLDSRRLDDISKSIVSYLKYLQSDYGVEAALFSLNEPETGVEIRQTAEEHRAFIAALGRQLAASGLSTKFMLGDTANFTSRSRDFLEPALRDNSVRPFIGAIAMHTWRGDPDQDLPSWVEAADQLQVPLLVTEGGVDAHAHEYPDLFREPWFQLDEVDLYVRTCNRARPRSILHWQLTTDYSLLAGRGIYDTEGPLRPTQRFWNLKQLAATPAGSLSLPVSADQPGVSCAAFVDRRKNVYTVHVVNRGGARPAVISGWPRESGALGVYVTDRDRGMERGQPLEVSDGEVRLNLSAESFTTLIFGE